MLRSIIHSTKPNSLGRLALFVVATVYLTSMALFLSDCMDQDPCAVASLSDYH